MKGTAKSKVVTSGRLTGGVKVQPARKKVTPNPGPAACPEPAYSLYSTDSEDQVTSLHKGLDRCAALLSGILQAEKADQVTFLEALPSLPRAVKGGAAKSRPCTSLGKKTTKKLPTKTDQKSRQSVRRGPGSTTPAPPTTARQSAAPSANTEAKLHPPQTQPRTLLRSHLPPSRSPTLQRLSPATPPPQTSTPPPCPTPHSDRLPLPLTASEAPHTHGKAERGSEEDEDEEEEEEEEEEEVEVVPVRDVNARSAAEDTHTCVVRTPHMRLEPGQVDGVPQDTHGGAETDVRTVQCLLGELRALFAGQGSVAERLLSHLEQAVSSPLMSGGGGGANIQTEPDLSSLHSQNTQLRRRVRILNQQLKEREKAERQQSTETLCTSEAPTPHEELATAQCRQQELQDALAELRQALQDTQAENALIRTDLKATRSRLLDCEQEKSELASLAQQRLEEIGNLKRVLQSLESPGCPAAADGSVSDPLRTKPHFTHHRYRREPPAERITQYLMSLGQPEPTRATEHVRVAAERDGSPRGQQQLTPVQLRDAPSHPDAGLQRGEELDSTLSQCDGGSAWSDRSSRSGSAFGSRDEAAFRDGLAALDASIASLQKTLQLDLGR